MGHVFTTTRPTPDMLQAAGHAPDRACNVPLQLACGVKGGAEIAVGVIRAALQQQPSWACISEDKVNGFNCVSPPRRPAPHPLRRSQVTRPHGRVLKEARRLAKGRPVMC